VQPSRHTRPRDGRSFAYALAYLFAAGMGSLLIVWILAKMTRTDEADFLVLRMGAALGVSALVLLASILLRRH
jgi:hypothetical protein